MDAASIITSLLTPEGRADRYPLYALAHELGPAVPAGDGMVLVCGYEAVRQALCEPGLGVDISLASLGADLGRHPSLAMLNRSVLFSNAPDHGRMRSAMSAMFTARKVATLEQQVVRVTDTLLDLMEASGTGPIDFMEAVAFPLPAMVICEVLGVPQDDRRRLHGLATDMMGALELLADPARLDSADRAAVEIGHYFTALVRKRRADPRDDLVTVLLQARDRGTLQSDEELVANLTEVLLAGLETTTYLLGNGLQVLIDHAEVRAQLHDGTVGMRNFVDEVLRYEPPGQATNRVALADEVVIGGIEVPAGSQVLLLLGAANRDPARYEQPDRFDPHRRHIQPLSFGGGAHHCVGALLGRLEATTVFSRLVARFPHLGSAPHARPTRQDRLILRAHETLPIVLAAG